MSFPFQLSPLSDPAIGTCGEGTYAVYCSSILAPTERFKHWYQYLNLSLAATAVFVSVLLSILHYARRRRQRQDTTWRQRNRQRLRDSKHEQATKNRGQSCGIQDPLSKDGLCLSKRDMCGSEKSVRSWRSYLFLWSRSRQNPLTSKDSSTSVDAPDFRRSIRTISLHSKCDADLDPSSAKENNLTIIPLLDKRHHEFVSQSCASSQHGSNSQTPFLSNVVGLVEIRELDFGDWSIGALTELGEQLDLLRIQKGYSGLVLRVSDDASCNQINEFLQVLWQRNINLFAMCDPDAKVLSSVDLGFLVGVIVENACILPNGHRREFFRSDRLRFIMGRCADVRVDRPGFFLGFLDLWRVQPTAAVARRAFKLAEYYGATLYHGLASESGSEGRLRPTCPMSLSGFDFLKCSEMVEVWSFLPESCALS